MQNRYKILYIFYAVFIVIAFLRSCAPLKILTTAFKLAETVLNVFVLLQQH